MCDEWTLGWTTEVMYDEWKLGLTIQEEVFEIL